MKVSTQSVAGWRHLLKAIAICLATLVGVVALPSTAAAFPYCAAAVGQKSYSAFTVDGRFELSLTVPNGRDATGLMRMAGEQGKEIVLNGQMSSDSFLPGPCDLRFGWRQSSTGKSGTGLLTITDGQLSGWIAVAGGEQRRITPVPFAPNGAGAGAGAGGGNAPAGGASGAYNNAIVEFARNSIGKCVNSDYGSDCECTRLVEAALAHVGAKPGSNYVWGQEVTGAIMPGDIIQFWSTKFSGPNSSWSTAIPGQHTAIVEAVKSGSIVTLIHQNDGEKITHRGAIPGVGIDIDLNWPHSGSYKVYRAVSAAAFQDLKRPEPGPAAGSPVTVALAVDLYAGPNGVGAPIGVLDDGTVGVTLLEACRDNWCHVKWPGHEGWVYSGPDYNALGLPGGGQ